MKYGMVYLALASAALSGCGQPPTSTAMKKQTEATHEITELSDSQSKQRDVAIAAKDKLFQSLLSELTASIGANGVSKSIEICKTRAPELAKSIGDEFGLRIGRTSFKLRNAESKPPSWATTFVDEHIEKEVNVALDDDQLGVLLPIRLKESCIKCHGSKESVSPEVADAIAGHYPQDNAMGFSEGDLRGYFWIEVPRKTANE